MDQAHFGVLLEKIDSNVSLLAESLGGVHQRLDEATAERRQLFEGQERIHLRLRVMESGHEELKQGQAKLEQRQGSLEQGQGNLEQGMVEIRDELRGVRRTVDLLYSTAGHHEVRLQAVEGGLREHLDKHTPPPCTKKRSLREQARLRRQAAGMGFFALEHGGGKC